MLKSALALLIFITYLREGQNKLLPVVPPRGFDPLQRDELMTCFTVKSDVIALEFPHSSRDTVSRDIDKSELTCYNSGLIGRVAQLVRAHGSHP